MAEKSLFQLSKRSVSPNLYQCIAAEIRQGLETGLLKPGDQLPTEKELCAMAGASRTAIREALKVLEGMGIVRAERGRGMFVATPQVPGGLNVSLGIRDFSWDVFQVLAVRRSIEPQAAAWACVNGTRRELTEISEHALRMRDLANTMKGLPGLGDQAEFTRLDLEFHSLVARAGHNKVYADIFDHIAGVMAEARNVTSKVPGRPYAAALEHCRMAELIQARKPDQASRQMAIHIERIQSAYLAALGDDRVGPKWPIIGV